jgi:ribosomal protein S12 methylthiotransferase
MILKSDPVFDPEKLKNVNHNRKINIITLGCSKNLVDSEKLMRQINAGGFDIIHDRDDLTASSVIINTCGFINDAKEESIETILRFVNAKRSGEIENLYVIGCLSERYMDELMKEIPEVSKYFGVTSLESILAQIGTGYRMDLQSDRIITGPGHYAYLKISEGCDRTCAFCTIPMIRGKYISRPVDEIISEARNLAEKGVKEIILVAQDLSYYGLDLYKKQRLPELISELSEIESLEWIRMHYLYPANFPLPVLEVMKNNHKICKYIDLPIQHISDKILKLMKRSHGANETKDLLTTIRSELPNAVIRTTIIAGHPGEGKEEFKELIDFISDFRFDRLGVFAYSHEEGTYGFNNYEDNLSLKTKESRVAELMSVQQSIAEKLNSEKTGKIFKVLIDRTEGEFFTGRTEYDSPEIDQEVLISNRFLLRPGKFYNVRITGSTEFDLYAEPV